MMKGVWDGGLRKKQDREKLFGLCNSHVYQKQGSLTCVCKDLYDSNYHHGEGR